MKFFLLIFCGFFLKAQAQISLNGSTCPELCMNPEINITDEKIEGLWFLQFSIPKFFELENTCTFLNVSDIGEKHLHFDLTSINNITQDARETIGTIEYLDDGYTTFFSTELELPFDYETIALTEDYWVIVTCHECGFYEEEGAGIYAKIYTRLQYAPCELTDVAIAELSRCNIYKDSLTVHNQATCPFC